MKVQQTPSGFQPGIEEPAAEGARHGYRGAQVQPDLPAQVTSRVFSPSSDLNADIRPEGTAIDHLADRLARHLERLMQWFDRLIGRQPGVQPGEPTLTPQSEPIETFPFQGIPGDDESRRPGPDVDLGDGVVMLSNPIETLPGRQPGPPGDPGDLDDGKPNVGDGIVSKKSQPIETFPGGG